MWGGGFGAFFHGWLSERLERNCIPLPTLSSPQLTSVLVCVCGRFTTKMLHYCCKSVSSFNASFLASLFSAIIYCNTRDFGSRKICQSPVARMDILMISCVFWVVRCDRICVWVCLSSSAVCVCVISIDLVIPDQALCGLHPSLYFA